MWFLTADSKTKKNRKIYLYIYSINKIYFWTFHGLSFSLSLSLWRCMAPAIYPLSNGGELLEGLAVRIK